MYQHWCQPTNTNFRSQAAVCTSNGGHKVNILRTWSFTRSTLAVCDRKSPCKSPSRGLVAEGWHWGRLGLHLNIRGGRWQDEFAILLPTDGRPTCRASPGCPTRISGLYQFCNSKLDTLSTLEVCMVRGHNQVGCVGQAGHYSQKDFTQPLKRKTPVGGPATAL